MDLNINDSKFLRRYNEFFDIDSTTKNLYDIEDTQVFEDARNGDTKALRYLAYLGTKTALTNFWAFLGPNPKSRKIRILNGDFEDYLGMCEEAIFKALKTFKEEYGESRKISATGFTYYFKRYLAKLCLSHNRNMNRNRAINNQKFASEGNDNGFENLLNEIPDESNNNFDLTKESSRKSFKMLVDTLKNWKFVKDKTAKFGVSPLELLYKFLYEAKNIHTIAQEVGMNDVIVKGYINNIVDEVNDHEDDPKYPVSSFEDVLEIAENDPEALKYLVA